MRVQDSTACEPPRLLLEAMLERSLPGWVTRIVQRARLVTSAAGHFLMGPGSGVSFEGRGGASRAWRSQSRAWRSQEIRPAD